MIVLAFDTCFGACSAAVFEQERVDADSSASTCRLLAARDEDMAVGHAERLMPMIAEVMAEAGVAFADLDALAVAPGPGTFTGVRTGIAAARGLVLATKLPVFGINSLELIARRARAELEPRQAGNTLAVCMDAGKGQIYAQMFAPDGSALSEPALTTAAEILASPADLSHTTIVGTAGNAFLSIAGHIGDGRLGQGDCVPVPFQPSARYFCGATPKAMLSPRPLYLRAPDAIPQSDTTLKWAIQRASP